MKKHLTSLLLFSVCVLNVENSYAQNVSHLANTVWAFHWDNDLHKDFIIFGCDNRAVSYSYEIDEFEFLEYTERGDTVILSTNPSCDKCVGKHQTDTFIYYYMHNDDCLSLLFSLQIKGEDRRYYYPSDSYNLCMIKSEKNLR